MKIEQNIISRDWLVEHEGKTYHINFLYSDGQTLALNNRDYWEILDEKREELQVCLMENHTKEEEKIAEANEKLRDELIKFCADNFLTYDFKDAVDENLKVI